MKAIGLLAVGGVVGALGLALAVAGNTVVGVLLLVPGVCAAVYGLILNHKDHIRR
jgi:hypothetical protein